MTELEPYPFQRRVAELLLSGKNVILQAPTGAGKTFAALLPFFRARREGLDFPPRCIYSVPMRVLANQFKDEYEHKYQDSGLRVSIQTGEHREDERFEADLVFATIDQVLSSFLITPYSLPRRLANLNAGAIASSYLVFDEFHLFDPASTLPTALEMLRMLRGIVPFLLMTATFSRNMLQGLAQALDATVVPEMDEDRKAMESLESQRKTRSYHLAEGPLTAEAILAHHRQRTLVVCNVVSRAQALFRALKEHPDLGQTNVLLLHSRFLPEDRARTEQRIRSVYAEGSQEKGSWITVATQVVEVGLDITCENLHTELAPANTIIQRAGRCARYKGETGDVYMYGEALDDHDEVRDLVERPQPYVGMSSECAATLRALAGVNGRALQFGEEQGLVNEVHGDRDRRIVEGLIGAQEMHRQDMNQVMRGDRSGGAGILIRDVVSQRVIIHDDPLTVLEAPFAYEAFALHPGTVQGYIKGWLTRAELEGLDDVGVRALHDMGDEDESGRSHYGWLSLDDPRDAWGAPLILVHPRLATYDSQMGFVSEYGGSYLGQAPELDRQKTRNAYTYRLELYDKHAELVWRESCKLWSEMAYTARHLEKRFSWPEGSLEQMSQLVAILHDTGKLAHGWQKWVRTYQKRIGAPVSHGHYAHTDSDPCNEQHGNVERGLGRKPAHAVEGAVAILPLLDRVGDCEAMVKAAFTTIARHHGPFSHTFQKYRLERGTEREIGDLLSRFTPIRSCSIDDLVTEGDPHELEEEVTYCYIDPQYDEEVLAYALLVRVLRLADQEATSIGSGAPHDQDQEGSHRKEERM